VSATSTQPEPTLIDYHDPDVQVLVPRLQQEYVRRYGGEDDTPLSAAEFSPPEGVFLLIRRDGAPVAMGGWRRHDEARSGRVPGERAVEIKRMYVAPEARGLGLARQLLAELERLAVAAGADWMVLESGQAQPEALSLYRSSGYADIAAFGHYCASEQSVHLGKPLGE
jgi:ribosomal protein S18 acetylase RimI-like enzyme